MTTQPKTQAGPPWCCFECGELATDLRCYTEFTNPNEPTKPLDAWGEHIWYLWPAVSCREAKHNSRVVRLGDAITPIAELTIDNIRKALSDLAAQYPDTTTDPADAIVRELLAGTLTPGAAADEIRALCEVAVKGAFDTKQSFPWQETEEMTIKLLAKTIAAPVLYEAYLNAPVAYKLQETPQ